MTRRIRSFSRPRPDVASNVVVETFQETLHGRPLTRPSPDFDDKVVGILARALELFPVSLHGFVLLPEGYRVLASYGDPEVMAGFQCHLSTNLSKQVGRSYGWRETVFPRRYGATQLSGEPEVELERLRRLLAAPVDADWVERPEDWPGVSCVGSFLSGEPLRGRWIDRAAYWDALSRGRQVTLDDFTEQKEVRLVPLPSLAHLSAEEYRLLVRGLVDDIEAAARARHRKGGTVPVGLAGVAALGMERVSVKCRRRRRRRPWFFALDPELKEALRSALLLIMAQYAAAAAELKKGNRLARFPLHTFAPTLGFVREVEILEPG